MSRRDEIDVMRATVCELKHCGDEFVVGHISSVSKLAYRVVLAIDATEIASCEKYSTRSICPGKWWLLAEMEIGG